MNLGLSLFRLQNLETTISHIHKRINEIDSIISDKKLETLAQARIIDAQKALKSETNKLNEVQAQVEASKLKLKFNQNALFGGKISNTRELQDLQMEAEALRRRIASLEDEQLDFMILVEAAQQNLSDAEKAYTDAIASRSEENAALLGEKIRIQGDLPDLNNQIQAIVKGIPQTNLEVYRTLLRSKNGLAVVEVIDNSCAACGYELAPADQQAARSPSTLLRCKTCSRILYKS